MRIFKRSMFAECGLRLCSVASWREGVHIFTALSTVPCSFNDSPPALKAMLVLIDA